MAAAACGNGDASAPDAGDPDSGSPGDPDAGAPADLDADAPVDAGAGASGPTISDLSVTGSPAEPGAPVQLEVSATSPSGGSLSYAWEIPEGWEGSDSGEESLVLTAPDEQAALGEVVVDVSDDEGTSSAEVEVVTWGPAIDDWTLDMSAGEPLAAGETLDISMTSYNRDGQPLTHHHDIGGLRFEDESADLSFAVEGIAMGGVYRVASIVEDDLGRTATAGANVAFQGVSAWPADGGDRQGTRRSLSPGAQGAGGSEAWSKIAPSDLGQSGRWGSPVVAPDGTVYAGASDDQLYALDPDDGSTLWTFGADGAMHGSSPALAADGAIYAASSDGNLYALEPDPGLSDFERVRWAFNPDGRDVNLSPPVIGADGTLYVGEVGPIDLNARVYAVDPSTGEAKWSFETGHFWVGGGPVLGADGILYFGSYDDHVYALDPADGSELWSFEASDSVASSPAVGRDGTVYAGSNGGDVYALDPADGSELWSFAAGDNIQGVAVGEEGQVYATSRDSQVYALDSDDGSEDWSFAMGSRARTPPTIGADGTIYAGSADDHLYALNPENGTDIWSFEAGDAVREGPALGPDGTVYVASQDERLYAID